MATNYRVKWSAAGAFLKGTVFSTEDAKGAGYDGQIDRWLKLGSIEETSDAVTTSESDAGSPEKTKGDTVDHNSGDTVEARAERRAEAVGAHNTGQPLTGGDAAARANPATGKAGTVTRTSTAKGADKP